MSQLKEVRVPDIGDFAEVEVIEILVKPGDTIATEQSLITVESDKASMEIPSSAAGTVRELRVKLGDKVSKGSLILMMEPGAGSDAAAAPAPAPAPAPALASVSSPAGVDAPSPAAQPLARAAESLRASPVAASGDAQSPVVKAHASPSVRRFARELGVDLAQVRGSGPKQRVLHEDVQAHVKAVLAAVSGQSGGPGTASSSSDAGGGLGLIPWPKVDFERFGPIERQVRPRIKKISAANLHRNWVMIPHVTNHDEAHHRA
jgi:pyruvate dehydrogenase E2 component (dihydrolipoamide acetyltransferase)